MTASNSDCVRFQLALGELLDGDPADEDRTFARAHRDACRSCAALEDDFRSIRSAAAQLAPLSPSRDIWISIEQRIQAPVIELAGPARTDEGPVQLQPERGAPGLRSRNVSMERRTMLFAAASLVLFSAGTTYAVTRLLQPEVESSLVDGSMGSTQTGDARSNDRYIPAIAPDDPGYGMFAAVARVYGEQIYVMQSVLAGRKARIDAGTSAVIERNLAVIDAAISECVQALAGDPSSMFLFDQYQGALEAKVALLRTAIAVPLSSTP